MDRIETLDQVKDLLANSTPFDKRRALYHLFWQDRLPQPDGPQLAISQLDSLDYGINEATISVVGRHLKEFPKPVSLVESLISHSVGDNEIMVGTIAAHRLGQIRGPKFVLNRFATLDRDEHWMFHFGFLALFGERKKWFAETQLALDYTNALFRGNYRTELRSMALYTICRHLPYQSSTTIQAIQDAIEDDNPQIRSDGQFYRQCWIEKHQAVTAG